MGTLPHETEPPGDSRDPQRDAHDYCHDLSEPVDAYRKFLVRFLKKRRENIDEKRECRSGRKSEVTNKPEAQ